MSDVNYPVLDTSSLMPRAEAETAIAGFEGRIASLESKRALTQVYAGTVGETAVLSLALGVRRYSVTVSGIATTDRIIGALGGIPGNGSLQDVYASAPNTVSVGVLTPALGIGAVVSVPVIIYKVN